MAATGANDERCSIPSIDGHVHGLQIACGAVGNLDDTAAKDGSARVAGRCKREGGKVPVVATSVVGGDATKPNHTRII